MGHTRLVFQRVLNQLKRWSKREHSLDRSGGSNLHVVVGGFRDVVTGWQISEALRHVRKCVVRLEKTAGPRVDEGNATGHVGQDLFVKDDFAFDALRRFDLALIISAAEPREDCRENNQPSCQDSHSCQEVTNRPLGETFRLLYYRDPTV